MSGVKTGFYRSCGAQFGALRPSFEKDPKHPAGPAINSPGGNLQHHPRHPTLGTSLGAGFPNTPQVAGG